MRGVVQVLVIVIAVASLACVAAARYPTTPTEESGSERVLPGPTETPAGATRETLWIFFADFSDETGDNAGWTVYDMSDTFAQENYWHIDTPFGSATPAHGDGAWWCGTRNDSTWGDTITLTFDNRYAIQHDYDWGIIDVSTDGGDTWSRLGGYSNPGLNFDPGTSVDWHTESISLSDYAGQDIRLRFLFESDEAYSSADKMDNPPRHSVRDGAWQIDNIQIAVNASPYFSDDCESGDTGWEHEDTPASGQVGQTFWRGQYRVDFETGREHLCDDREEGTWMYTAVDPFSNALVDRENAWLLSPPVDIVGAASLVAAWDMWIDCSRDAHDYHDLWLVSHDARECAEDLSALRDEERVFWGVGGYGWETKTDEWDEFAGNDWLAMNWRVCNEEPPEPSAVHMAGILLNWVKVGIPSGAASRATRIVVERHFRDWFGEQLAEALTDSGRVKVTDADGIATVTLIASNDGGLTWSAYPCRRESPPDGTRWIVPPPAGQMVVGSEIRYYFEAMDNLGNLTVRPSDAPDRTFEFSILPIPAEGGRNTNILLVDKHGGLAQNEHEQYGHEAQYYYEEALEILGYDWNRFDVRSPSADGTDSDGPILEGLDYYETVIWFGNDLDWNVVKPGDQENLVSWLAEASEDKERNLLLTGNDIGHEIVVRHGDPYGLYGVWMATLYNADSIGTLDLDVCDAGFGFMTHEDGCCDLLAGCPQLPEFDEIEPMPGTPGAVTILEYVRSDLSTAPAAVAYDDPVTEHQTINLGFGFEYMGDLSEATVRGDGGLADRVDLMENILNYFGVAPAGSGTGVADGSYRNAISDAYPNPFNPSTTIEYSVKEAGRTTITIYTVGGRLVRTLLDDDLAAGAAGKVVWDGRDDAGEPCGSGIYFCRVEAPGFTSERKAVLLK